jgi:hypothetical protein
MPGVQSPEFRPQRVFIARDSLMLSPRAEHCLQTESIWIFHVLVQSRAECPSAQKDQSDLEWIRLDADSRCPVASTS